jgi:putative Mn2+ efflux pump MntP
VSSFTVIIVSEIGDKTFLIAAILAMKHPRSVIFASGAAALVLMTVLSAGLGYAVPNLISRHYTQLLAAVLFLVFGIKMIKVFICGCQLWSLYVCRMDMKCRLKKAQRKWLKLNKSC